MAQLNSLYSALGGRSALKRIPKTSQDWHDLLEMGLPLSTLEGFKLATGMSDAQVATLIGISGKTLQRARANSTRLDAITSDRLFRAARIVTLAAHVLENSDRGLAWLWRAQIGLGGKTPLSLMTTEAGCDEVEKLLLRIEHSVYS